MKYILITLDNNVRKEFKSLSQMSKDLNTTYCSVYNNFLLHETPYEVKPPKKLSQVKFNRKYKIISLDQ